MIPFVFQAKGNMGIDFDQDLKCFVFLAKIFARVRRFVFTFIAHTSVAIFPGRKCTQIERFDESVINVTGSANAKFYCSVRFLCKRPTLVLFTTGLYTCSH